MIRLSLVWLVLVVTGLPLSSALAADKPTRRTSPVRASAAEPAAAAGLRILLVDDDLSDNNHYPGDSRLSPSDRIFRQLVADAVGRDANAWSVEAVKPYGNGPGLERMRPFSLIVWYTGASYGGNPDNTAVLSIEDEKTVRRYLEETGGAVILVSPGYLGKVLSPNGTGDTAVWPFLSEVLGVRGGVGLAQRFEPGVVKASDGAAFKVGKGSAAIESQFSTITPEGAAVVFTTLLNAAKKGEGPAAVATVNPYGRGRIVYVGFTLENLADADLAPAFQTLIAASSAQKSIMSVTRPAGPVKKTVAPMDVGPVTVTVTGTPSTAIVSWTLRAPEAVTGASITTESIATRKPVTTAPPPPSQPAPVTVERLVPNAAAVKLNLASANAAQANDPGPLTPGVAVTYRVTVTDASGATGSREATYTPPQPKDPDSLSAAVQTDGSIILTWPEVPGVVSYQIKADDNGIAPVVVRNATEWRSPQLNGKARRWTVNSMYEPGGSLTAAANWPAAQTPKLPNPGAAFLSKPAGAGSLSEADAHYRRQCGSIPLQDCSAENVLLTSTIWQKGTWGEFRMVPGAPGKPFVFADVRTYLTPNFYSVSFADVNDLGRGRRVGCANGLNFSGQSTIVCWATSHGAIPAAGAVVNGTALAQAATQYANRNDMSLSTIVITSLGAMFGTWVPSPPPWPASQTSRGAAFGDRADNWSPDWWGTTKNDLPPDWLKSRNWDLANLVPWQREAIIAAVARPALTIAFDSQGPKSVPHACLSCHGGRYDATSRLVQGASLLPLIPGDLVFASPSVRASTVGAAPWPDSFQDSEEAIRGINAIVFRSNPSPTIKQRLKTLYNATTSPGDRIGMRADDLAVPPGWAAQRGLYQQVIAPYCGSCHFAQSGSLSFGSWAEVLQVKQAIQRVVCTDFTMPHSEILFRKFWTQSGAVSLPGLLSTSLGFQKCR